MRKPLLMQQRTSAIETTYGQQQLTWVDLASFFGQIVTVSGAQLARSQSIYNLTSHHVITRYQSAFANIKQVGSYRIVYVTQGVTRYFDIGATLNEDQRDRTITLLCSEGLNDGQ